MKKLRVILLIGIAMTFVTTYTGALTDSSQVTTIVASVPAVLSVTLVPADPGNGIGYGTSVTMNNIDPNNAANYSGQRVTDTNAMCDTALLIKTNLSNIPTITYQYTVSNVAVAQGKLFLRTIQPRLLSSSTISLTGGSASTGTAISWTTVTATAKTLFTPMGTDFPNSGYGLLIPICFKINGINTTSGDCLPSAQITYTIVVT